MFAVTSYFVMDAKNGNRKIFWKYSAHSGDYLFGECNSNLVTSVQVQID